MDHRILTANDIPAYVAGRPELAPWGAVVDVTEIGDGNLNNVWRVQCDRGSLVLKQSMPYVRIDESWALTPARATFEARSYETWEAFAPGVAPKLHAFDEDLFAMVVEDLGDHRIWREALSAGHVHAEAARRIGAFVARSAFHTGALGQSPSPEHDAFRRAGDNPVMTALMEDVLFRFPYEDHPHNSYAGEVAHVVRALREDTAYRDALDALHARWTSVREALVHGDLHTGSVMVADGSARVIDSEFSFYGPVAWDLGELMGNLLLAAVRARVLAGRRCPERAPLAEAVWAGFEDEVRSLWAADRVAPFPETWLARTRRDAVGYAGVEMVRRIVGSGKAEDIATLPEAQHAAASRVALLTGGRLVIDRDVVAAGDCSDAIDASTGGSR